ncbi:MAG: hypothetical protein V1777_00535 [Candidatus Micrarchaeota archaeon]
MNESPVKPLLVAYAWITFAALCIALTCFLLVQGFLVHVGGNTTGALFLYAFAWICFGLGILLFLKGKRQLRFASLPA